MKHNRMLSRTVSGFPFAFGALVLLGGCASAETSLDILIVAGQSNALNWHAAAEQLPADSIDASIPFFHRSGAPADRGFDTPVNASSHGEWTLLGPQEQIPYVKYERTFFGPEISLARRLANGGENRVAVIKIAYFGTNLAQDWHPDATAGNQLYADLIVEIRDAVEKLTAAKQQSRIAGFFWMQGETDGANSRHAEAYARNLATLIDAVRRDLAVPDLPFVIGRVGPRPPNYPFQEIVRSAQVAVAASDPDSAWVDTDDLPRETDGIHLLAPGVIILGQRMADVWREISP